MKALIVALALVLAGCASAPMSPQAGFLFKPRPTAAQSAPDIDTTFYQTLAGCQSVLQGFEAQSNVAKQWGVALQTVGGILGAVLLPVAVVKNMAESVVVLLGAGAGFTNTEVSVVKNEALDAASILAARASVLAGMQTALTGYYTDRSVSPPDLNKLQADVDKLRVACISYYLASPNSAPVVPVVVTTP